MKKFKTIEDLKKADLKPGEVVEVVDLGSRFIYTIKIDDRGYEIQAPRALRLYPVVIIVGVAIILLSIIFDLL